MLGNLVGGVTFVGLTLYATHARTGATRARPSDIGAPERRPVPAEVGAPLG